MLTSLSQWFHKIIYDACIIQKNECAYWTFTIHIFGTHDTATLTYKWSDVQVVCLLSCDWQVTSNHTELLVALNWIKAFLPYLYVSLLCVLCIDWIHMRSVVSAYTRCISRIKQILIKFCIVIRANYPEIVVWFLI